MSTKRILTIGVTLLHLLFVACDGGPKTIPLDDAGAAGAEKGTGVFSDGPSEGAPSGIDPAIGQDLHTVVAVESLPTSKYVYVRVKEGEDEFWIATSLQEITVGRSYFYRGGLLKTDFPSKEYNRTFERLYLVSQLVPSDHGSMGGASNVQNSSMPSITSTAPLPALDVAGTTKISELMDDPKKYGGKTIQVSGKCTKVNPNIMGRNWIHVKDGSRKDAELVITTDVPIAEGQEVTMIGTVALDKDFGSGYRYGILLEGGLLVK